LHVSVFHSPSLHQLKFFYKSSPLFGGSLFRREIVKWRKKTEKREKEWGEEWNVCLCEVSFSEFHSPSLSFLYSGILLWISTSQQVFFLQHTCISGMCKFFLISRWCILRSFEIFKGSRINKFQLWSN
jgi:hypothetical protein